ncbi:MAG: hypothetical protein ABIX01_10250 [Chitinophagaceae bacterium]
MIESFGIAACQFHQGYMGRYHFYPFEIATAFVANNTIKQY